MKLGMLCVLSGGTQEKGTRAAVFCPMRSSFQSRLCSASSCTGSVGYNDLVMAVSVVLLCVFLMADGLEVDAFRVGSDIPAVVVVIPSLSKLLVVDSGLIEACVELVVERTGEIDDFLEWVFRRAATSLCPSRLQ